jgi:type I restriction enzyme S subunit
MTGAAGQQRVSQDFVANFPVPLPSPDEQDEILQFIERETSRFRTAIAVAEREISLIREYRTRLIADVVTGKLDVRHLASSPESLATDEVTAIDPDDLDDEFPEDDEAELVEEAADAD